MSDSDCSVSVSFDGLADDIEILDGGEIIEYINGDEYQNIEEAERSFSLQRIQEKTIDDTDENGEHNRLDPGVLRESTGESTHEDPESAKEEIDE